MPNSSLVLSLYQIGAIQFGDFTLKSGQSSSLYLNLRKIISHPDLLRRIANAVWQVSQPHQYDLVCGVPYTALPIATCISLDHHLPMIIRRKETKDYGTKQKIEGDYQPHQRCLVVEDVITSGTSLLETTKDLEKEGLKITDVTALIDREQGGRQTLEKQFRVHSVLRLSDMMDILLDSTLVSRADKAKIHSFLAEQAPLTS